MCSTDIMARTIPKALAIKDADVRLRIVGALSGETLLESLEASLDWSVRHLKLAVARMEGSESTLELLYEGALLDNSAILSFIISQVPAECIHTLGLVRTPAPFEIFLQPLHRRMDQVVVQSVVSSVRMLSFRLHRRLLESSDKIHVAPTFSLSFSEDVEVPFKLAAVASSDMSFKRSGGRGHVQLKCIGDLPAELADVDLRVTLGKHKPFVVSAETEDGICRHNFATSSSARLPKQADVGFAEAVDTESGFCDITVEMVVRRG